MVRNLIFLKMLHAVRAGHRIPGSLLPIRDCIGCRTPVGDGHVHTLGEGLDCIACCTHTYCTLLHSELGSHNISCLGSVLLNVVKVSTLFMKDGR